MDFEDVTRQIEENNILSLFLVHTNLSTALCKCSKEKFFTAQTWRYGYTQIEVIFVTTAEFVFFIKAKEDKKLAQFYQEMLLINYRTRAALAVPAGDRVLYIETYKIDRLSQKTKLRQIHLLYCYFGASYVISNLTNEAFEILPQFGFGLPQLLPNVE